MCLWRPRSGHSVRHLHSPGRRSRRPATRRWRVRVATWRQRPGGTRISGLIAPAENLIARPKITILEISMDFKRKLLIAALPLVFCVACTPKEDIKIKFAEVHPAGYAPVVAEQNMGKKLEEQSKGEISFKMYAGGVLGSEKEVVEQVQSGAVQMTRVSLGIVGPVVPDVNVFNLPFVFRDQAHMRTIIDGEIGQEILDKITNSQFNMVALAWMDGGTRNLYTKKPVRQISDLKGMKIRVQGNPVFIETINDMGGNGIAMATGEIFSALQTGVIDGAENNPPTYFQHNHYQNAKFFTITEHLILPEPIVMAKTTWEKLNPEQQALVKKLAREAQMEERVLWDKSSADAETKLKAAGVEFITLTPEQKKAFYDATQPVRDKFGAPYKALIERINAVQTNPALAATSTPTAQ
ncbi:TRAP dicarboxylate transporter-DctP subunit [Pseudomonas coronafaciens pv. coronafaciens]|uniref:TRAP dicarboxylate transporter subunit DctP n=5 Tax=Pseudomonas syringae group TaxID=136849 RepID=A0AB37QUV5_9PSED|nr:TRAP dicarboxylate transporter-DctP subunit [Pseudomonas coronafaciens pv. zizaniae]RMS05596.1 TRAP dicarboxylate transporter subunit DctP [Pseudomonas coronafaciens pv. garcae]RMS14821.1 TRAP dicarboxylate transporter-DctP subunit [Pseudomonas coronafaciens pv. coronafaciens]RMV64311.1 TRAP dicarboxylate transporter-DctP subunit [Pseudomonas coronafaciens pv. atropurpurea]RMV98209.1 TRAP dicarboxylate transporter subunit DctP [Pseudomonas coronafaciens pv. porri]